MATTRILDHYRSSIITNKNLFRVLSIIYREGTISESDLEKKAELQEKTCKKILNDLYRSNLAKLVPPDKWRITEFAEEILCTLGISETSAISYINEQPISESNKLFLRACIEYRAVNDLTWSRNLNSLLRSVTMVFLMMPKDKTRRKELRSRALNAIVIGSDPNMSYLKKGLYWQLVLKWHKVNNTHASTLIKGFRKKQYDDVVEKALDDYKSSNTLFLTGKRGLGKSATIITCGRLMSNISEARDTSRLKEIYLSDKDIYSRALNEIFITLPSFKSKLLEWYNSTMGIPVRINLETVQTEFVGGALIPPLKNTTEQAGIEHVFFKKYLDLSEGILEDLDPDFSCLVGLTRKIKSGIFDALSEENQHELYSRIKRLKESVEIRFPSYIKDSLEVKKANNIVEVPTTNLNSFFESGVAEAKKANNIVEVLTTNLSSFFESGLADTIKRRLEENINVKVKILTLGPESDFAAHRARQLRLLTRVLREQLRLSLEKTSSYFLKYSNRCFIATFDEFTPHLSLRVDDIIYYNMLSSYQPNNKNVLLRYNEADIEVQESIINHFDTVWKRSVPFHRIYPFKRRDQVSP